MTTTLASPVATRATAARSHGGSFVRVVRAELRRASRARSVIALMIGAAAFAVVAGISAFLSAEDTAVVSRRSGPRLSDLASAGGATEAFATGASFAGFLVFVTYIALIAGEFSGGTFRAMLLRYPNRTRLLVGKLSGLLIVTAGAVALAEVLTVGVSVAMAPSQDVATADWFTLDGLRAAIEDFATAYAGVAGWAVFGATLGVVFRTIPLALGVGFAWAGPFENIIVDSWEPGYRYFPGQVMGSLIRGGTAELGFGRAALTAAIYTAIAFAITLILTSRRDVTS